MYKAEILADSLSPQGDRLTTMKITFPRFILAEFNTHRMFSRNSASSRAIPFKKMVEMVQENPFIPIAWQKDHKGMQGTEYWSDKLNVEAKEGEWLIARNHAINQATQLSSMGVTKQLCNRLLEPFMWHTVIVSATEWDNFFNLRCPQYSIEGNNGVKKFRSKKDAKKNFPKEFDHLQGLDWLQINQSQADIHIQAIAELMWDAYNESTPKQLKEGEWHIPFGDIFDLEKLIDIVPFDTHDEKEFVKNAKIKIATARCARISYQTLGDNPKIDYEADLRLHDTLAKSGHWSPFEHVARAMSDEEYYGQFSKQEGANNIESGWCRNFKGFIQYRHLIENNYE